MKFSSRTSFGVSEPNALSLLLEKKKAEGVGLLDLTESNPTRCAFRALSKELLAPLQAPLNIHYEPSARGLIVAREAISGYYADRNISVHPDDVFVACGTSEAYSMLFHLLCEAGDEVLCQSPAYPLVDHLASYAGIRTRHFSGAVPAAEKAKALVVVNPANPSGRYTDENAWMTLDASCEKNGLAVISDEVFFEFDWRKRPRISGACLPAGRLRDLNVLHFTLNGVSKMLGLPQMKLAWIVLSGPEKERRQAAERLEAIADAFLSVSTPPQNALPYWLKHRQDFIEEALLRVKANFAELNRALGQVLPEPEGGWYALVPLDKGRSDEETSLRLLEEQDLLVHPGYFFDLEKESLVVSLLSEQALFSQASKRLFEGLNT